MSDAAGMTERDAASRRSARLRAGLARVRLIDPAALREQYEAGASTVDLALEHGLSRPTIRALLRRAGARLRTIREAKQVAGANAWLRTETPQRVTPGSEATDIFGRVFRVRSLTPARHGFDLLRGLPPGTGGRGGIILTRELAAHLEHHRLEPGRLDLPLSEHGILNLRRRMGFDSRAEKRAWWQARRAELDADDPAVVEALAAERGVTAFHAFAVRRRICGLRRPAQASWLDEVAKRLILSDRSRREIAASLGITPLYVSQLRKQLRDEAAAAAAESATTTGDTAAGSACERTLV